MIADRRSLRPRAGHLFTVAMAALVGCLTAVGCGTKPPPPGAEKETSDLDVDLGSDIKSPAEESQLLHKPGAAGSQADAPADLPEKAPSATDGPTEDEPTDAKDQ